MKCNRSIGARRGVSSLSLIFQLCSTKGCLQNLLVDTDIFHITACRDPADGTFLDLAVNGHADVVVSGDRDLLALNSFRGNSHYLRPSSLCKAGTVKPQLKFPGCLGHAPKKGAILA